MDGFVLLIGTIFASILGIMLSVYLTLSFICWAGDVIENKKWRDLWD